MFRKGRFFTIILLLVGFFSLLIWKLTTLQILEGAVFAEKAQQLHKMRVRIPPIRGNILDKSGELLALNVPCYSIFWRKQSDVWEREKLRKAFLLVNKDWEQIEKKIYQGASFIYLARDADGQTLKSIKKIDAESIEWKERKKRSYPNGQLAANVVGFTDVDSKGLEGVELRYREFLQGTATSYMSERDGLGNNLPSLVWSNSSSTRGGDVYLTLDKVIQYIVESEIEKTYEKFEPKSVIAVALNPNTGEVLALANLPTYDPNNYKEHPSSHYRNRSITDLFEPGSTFKIITAAAALEEKLYSPETKVFCENGSYRVARHIVHDHHPYGMLTFRETLEHSSNIGFTKIGQKMGEATLYRYVRAFGFGEKTGIDLPGELKGILRPLSQWSKLSIAAIPFGQEIGVTPLQLTTAVAVVANEGVLMKPYIVDRIVDGQGRTLKKNCPQEVRKVISPPTAHLLTQLLVGVVENGTGQPARIPGYRIAGKTGTSQKYIPGKGYSHRIFTSSFIGYAPAFDPEIVLLIMVDEPNGAYYGAQVAAPPFKRIIRKVLRHLEIPPNQKKIRMAYAAE